MAAVIHTGSCFVVFCCGSCPFHLQFFHHNSNVMEISFCSHPNTNKDITTIFGTWHDSWAVVACGKFCCNMVISNWITAKWNFHRIWIVMEKSLVKWARTTVSVDFTHIRHHCFTDTGSIIHLNTLECCYNKVQSNRMLHTSLKWGGHNINRRLNLLKTHYILP